MKENAILLLIKEIKKSLESGNYLSALIVALTIPDICGKILYPKETNGKRYKKWVSILICKIFMTMRIILKIYIHQIIT